MKKTWKTLYDKYPCLQFLTWGIECGIGWYDLLDECLNDITLWYEINHPDELIQNYSGDPLVFEGFVVLQIKEKYGTLRFYVGSSYDEVFDIIEKAEKKSYTTCEQCGKTGELRSTRGWYNTLCDKHYKEWLNR